MNLMQQVLHISVLKLHIWLIAQLVEHFPDTEKVLGANLSKPTRVNIIDNKMEEKKEENKDKILNPYELLNFRRSLSIAVGTFRSIRRAAKRGHIVQFGSSLNIIGRPFNNRANTSTRNSTHSRRTNEQKKLDYENAKRYSTKQSLQ